LNNLFAGEASLINLRKYKGSRIEWDTDECAQALEIHDMGNSSVKHTESLLNRPAETITNRFQLLEVDERGQDIGQEAD
jgi:hypothetical protein